MTPARLAHATAPPTPIINHFSRFTPPAGLGCYRLKSNNWQGARISDPVGNLCNMRAKNRSYPIPPA
jgi:hypothetical protein